MLPRLRDGGKRMRDIRAVVRSAPVLGEREALARVGAIE